MSVNQKDIARRLDLSIATVSRSLCGHPDIHSDTRKKVIRIASQMGYRPKRYSPRGKTAASDKLVSAGALFCRGETPEENPTTAAYHMLAGISAASGKLDVSLAINFVPPERCHPIAQLRSEFPALRTGMLSGMVLAYDFPRETVRDLSTLMPCVSLVHPHLDLGVDCIGCNQDSAVGMAMDHLYQLGHRRIGFISTLEDYAWVYPRFSGYLLAIKRLGLTHDTSIIINVFNHDLDADARADTVAKHFRGGVTAWICAEDSVGYELYPRLVDRGLRIPQDISLVGFTGLLPPPTNCPQLTTIHPPFERIGAAAIRRLINRIKHPDEPVRNIEFCCEFVKGETTGINHRDTENTEKN